MTDDELRQLFTGVTGRIDRLDAKVETLHENTLHRVDRLAEIVASVDQKLERISADLSARIPRN